MDVERLQERIADFCKGVYQLERAIAQPVNEFTRDATIQRFEFCYELAWKLLKTRLQQEGIEALTPRQALREALQAEWLDNGNIWSEIQRYRNLTSHTYNERLADEVYEFICQTAFVQFQTLVRTAETWKN